MPELLLKSEQSKIQKKEKVKENWHVLEFSAPITENAVVDDEFIIKGTAITETTTLNNHKYIAEELDKAAPGMVGRPLLVDHNNTVESIKGKVINAFFETISRSIQFEAKIMDKKIQEMVNDGRISSVSIGAFAEDLVKDEDSDALIAKGITIAELSLVAVPADENATFASAMTNNFKLKESLEKEVEPISNSKIVRRYGEMTEKEVEEIEKIEGIKEENKKLMEQVESMKEEKRQQLIGDYSKLCIEKKVGEKDISKVSEETIQLLIEQLKEIVIVKEEKKETKEKKEMKAEVSVKETEDIEDLEKFVVEKSTNGKGFSMWMEPDVSKWSELHKDWNLAGDVNGS